MARAAGFESGERMSAFESRHAWFFLIVLLCVVIIFASLIHYLLFRFTRLRDSGGRGVQLAIRRYLSRPARFIAILTCVLVALPFVPVLTHRLRHLIEHGTAMALVASLGWFVAGLVYVFEAVLLPKYDLTATDNARARKIHTQFQVIRRLIIVLIAIITLAGVLWTFNNPRIWQYGTGLLASAGVASLLLATAAKSTASNMLAGIQIAFTGMIRIDDVLIVEGELGRVLEIRASYIVLENWDLRRMIVPLSYFVENPFFNWTRDGADVVARAFLYMDYSIPVEEVRAQFRDIVQTSKFWDGKICDLHVTEFTDRAIELRCQVSATDRIQGFELCCLIRERILAWIRENYPESLPMTRFRMLQDHANNASDGAREPEGKGFIRST